MNEGLGKIFDLIDTSATGVIHIEGVVEFFHRCFHDKMDVLLEAIQMQDGAPIDESNDVPLESSTLRIRT